MHVVEPALANLFPASFPADARTTFWLRALMTSGSALAKSAEDVVDVEASSSYDGVGARHGGVWRAALEMRSLLVCRQKCSSGSSNSVPVTCFRAFCDDIRCPLSRSRSCPLRTRTTIKRDAHASHASPRNPRRLARRKTPRRPARGSHDSHQSEALTAGPTALKKLRGRRADARRTARPLRRAPALADPGHADAGHDARGEPQGRQLGRGRQV